MYRKTGQNQSFPEREKQILQFWKDEHIFEKSEEINHGKDSYVFYDGPPTANGKPHIGHVLTRVIKDTVPRYHVMKGQDVPARRAGIPTACRWSWRWKRSWAWTARSRSRNTAWRNSSIAARKASGPIRGCGRISPTRWASGPIWSIPT